MFKQCLKKVAILCLLVLMVPCLVWAQTDSREPSGERKKPPQAAFDACKDKSEGASVEITTPRGTVKATCKSFEGQLVAVPAGAPPPPSSTTTGQ